MTWRGLDLLEYKHMLGKRSQISDVGLLPNVEHLCAPPYESLLYKAILPSMTQIDKNHVLIPKTLSMVEDKDVLAITAKVEAYDALCRGVPDFFEE